MTLIYPPPQTQSKAKQVLYQWKKNGIIEKGDGGGIVSIIGVRGGITGNLTNIIPILSLLLIMPLYKFNGGLVASHNKLPQHHNGLLQATIGCILGPIGRSQTTTK